MADDVDYLFFSENLLKKETFTFGNTLIANLSLCEI